MTTKILSDNVQFCTSERMTDADDGGGEMTGTVITDNKINQLFGPISSSDRVAGRINLRQAYLHINTATDDTYYGANLIIDAPPTDPTVTALLFSLGKSGAEHTDARSSIESYISIGPRSQMQPLGAQNAGQQQITAYQRITAPIPEVGDTYVLSIEGTNTTQAFRIQAVSSHSDTFAYTNGSSITDFPCTVVTMTISQPLTVTFPGADPTPLMPGASWIRTSMVSTGANYCGITPLAANIATNNRSLTVASTQAQIVPVSITETSIVDTKPPAVTITLDAGNGNLVEVANFAHTRSDEVTSFNNKRTWNATLAPIPAPASLTISYRTGGRWYTLTDDGTGAITGASTAYGGGSLSFLSGAVSVTLGDLPDIDSAIVWMWGADVHYEQRLNATVQKSTTVFSLNESVDAGTLVVKYLKNGTQHTTSCDSTGVITGADVVSGYVVQPTGDVSITWSTMPDAASQLEVDYNHTDQYTETPSGMSFTLAHTPVKPGSVVMKWNATSEWWNDIIYEVTATRTNVQVLESTGRVVQFTIGDVSGSLAGFGPINYTSGACALTIPDLLSLPIWDARTYKWFMEPFKVSGNQPITVSYSLDSATPVSRVATVPLPPMTIAIGTNLTTDTIVPGSVRFTLNGYEYRDYGDGTVWRHVTPWTTQVGTQAGSIDYFSRTVTLAIYASGTGNVTMLSCLTQYGNWPMSYAYGRTPGSPISPGSFYVRALTTSGASISAQSDQSGQITSDQITGTVNQDMGVFALAFGATVAGVWTPTQVIADSIKMNCVINTSVPLSATELGLDPIRLPSTGKVPIFKSGSRIVIHNTQPLTLSNPAVAGATIDCGRTRIARVRLEDAMGRRLPDSCFYPGQYVQFSSLTTDQKALYAWYDIHDDGTVWLPSSMDLDAGKVELASPLVLTGYTQPLTLYHTTEDSVLATAVDLSGVITVNAPISRAYNTSGTYVSSQLFVGDIWARYTNLFSQVTWTGVWQDTLIGSTTGSQYNDALYPIVVTNDGVIDEQWRITFAPNSTTNFSVYGARVGLIAVGDINHDCAPANPVASNPYFFLDHRGWGTGWGPGNTLRFDTVWPGAFWVARCISPGTATGSADTIGIACRGDSSPA